MPRTAKVEAGLRACEIVNGVVLMALLAFVVGSGGGGAGAGAGGEVAAAAVAMMPTVVVQVKAGVVRTMALVMALV